MASHGLHACVCCHCRCAPSAGHGIHRMAGRGTALLPALDGLGLRALFLDTVSQPWGGGRTTTTTRRRPGNQAPSSKRQPTRPAATRFRSDTRLDWPRPARHRHRVLACRAEQSRVQCAGQSSEREQAAGGACTHLVSRRGCTHVVAHGRLFFLFGRLLSSSPAMAKCAQHHAQDGVESGGAGDSRGNTAAPSHCAASASASVCCCCCCLLPALSSRFGVFPART